VNDAVHQPDRRSGLRALLRAGVAAQLLAVSAPRVGFVAAVEVSSRAHFKSFAQAVVADRELLRADALCVAVLRTALPPEVLEGVAAQRSYGSGRAAACITDIYDFVEWSTRHLARDVVGVLHHVLSEFERCVALHPGVVRAMTYGDRFVACAGLLTPVDEPVALLVRFATAQSASAFGVSAVLGSPFALRASVAGGTLAGGIVGDAASRFVIVGAALDAAAANLAALGPNGVHVSAGPAAASAVPTTAPSSAALNGCAAPLADRERGTTGSVRAAAALPSVGFSRLWLRFDDADVQLGMDAANARRDAELRFVAAVPLLASAGYLAILLLGQAQPDAWRRHADDALSWVLLPAAFAAALTRYALFRAWPGLPVPVDSGLGAAALLAISLAGTFGQHRFVRPSVAWLAVGCMPHFRRLPWMAQAAVSFLVVGAWTIVWRIRHPFLGVRSGSQLSATVIAVVLPPAFTFVLYRTAHGRCVKQAAWVTASRAVAAAGAKLGESDRLLVGAVPAHTIPFVAPHASPDGRDPLVRFSRRRELSVTRVALHVAGAARTQLATAQAVWHGMWSLVAGGSAGLEMVEAAGDAFMVAGPFGCADTVAGRDRDQQTAAIGMVALLKAFCAHLSREECTLTAVAATGTATGALLGAALLSYRLVGPAVREACALLDAAPLPLAPTNLAFASEGFVRQHRNFAALRLGGADPRMSLAVPDGLIGGDGPGRFGTPSGARPAEATPFGATAQWRVRGVGVATVHRVILP
jgi:hypothetical protein